MTVDVDKYFDQTLFYSMQDLAGFNSQEWKKLTSNADHKIQQGANCKQYHIYERRLHHDDFSWILVRAIIVIVACIFTLGCAFHSKGIRKMWKEVKTGDEVQKIKVLDLDNKREILTSPDLLRNFYTGKGEDFEGRTLAGIQQLSLKQKESIHNYIQWLFPLKTRSRFNPNSPVLTDEILQYLPQDPEVKKQVAISFQVMLNFYGLESSEGRIQPNCSFGKGGADDRSQVWLSRNNHNHDRLSRILESLHLFGLDEESNALFKCLEKINQEYPSKISGQTWGNWCGKHALLSE